MGKRHTRTQRTLASQNSRAAVRLTTAVNYYLKVKLKAGPIIHPVKFKPPLTLAQTLSQLQHLQSLAPPWRIAEQFYKLDSQAAVKDQYQVEGLGSGPGYPQVVPTSSLPDGAPQTA